MGVKIDTIIRFTGNPKSFADQKTLCCLRSLSVVDVLDSRDLAGRDVMFYDVLVIGNEVEGLDRAISAARAGRRVGIVAENRESVSLSHVRCAAMSLQRSANGGWTMGDWRQAAIRLSQSEAAARLAIMKQLGIERLEGTARLISSASVDSLQWSARPGCRVPAESQRPPTNIDRDWRGFHRSDDSVSAGGFRGGNYTD